MRERIEFRKIYLSNEGQPWEEMSKHQRHFSEYEYDKNEMNNISRLPNKSNVSQLRTPTLKKKVKPYLSFNNK